ncbi:MAG TPA: hypothetical protein VK928_02390, partial [Longimicrobiales bacterium]|nr:hypothetical protein [Longimicrobiales bacterium]
VVTAVGCGAGGAAQDGAGPGVAVVTVDSIFPMPEMIARFQARVGTPVAGLPASSATSREELVERFVRAVEDSSVGALRALRMDARQYAYLYVPTSRMTGEPYRQPPELGWLLVEQNGLKGEARVLRRFGGRSLGYRGHACGEPVVEGTNTLWEDCTLDLDVHDVPIRLFGTILERDGRYALVSIANDL